ncbi:cytochrome-c peroxidase [Dyadobacter sp. CY323]|uniref:cytochrome-c peroxidase n=1 Tax=Dyadobacter sp. CY323 TaxID=2907302 RepID=UPI001F38A319|nr:cytochrome c peroxidase [Dyadobacter sp. CY323]MCE6990018.1 cytochrome C peroxidase [Dyadobacter sp. CY323]
MKKRIGPAFLIFLLAHLLTAAIYQQNESKVVSETISRFKSDSKNLSASLDILDHALSGIDNADEKSILHAKIAMADSRLAYKKLEYFMEYFFTTSSRIYNRAPKNEVEEPFLEWQAPAGFQYIEQMLFDTLPEDHRKDFRDQVRLLKLSSEDLPSLLYRFSGTEGQILESIRLQLIRIITLGVTGFDAPSLKTGIRESKVALETMQPTLLFYSKNKNRTTDSVAYFLEKSIHYLSLNTDFDTFNRMEFLTEHALPLQKHLGILIRSLNLEVNKSKILNYNAEHLFSRDAIHIHAVTGRKSAVSKDEIRLGKRLFFEKRLSGNGKRNCASCHNPDTYFSDSLVRSKGFRPNTVVRRNAPSLLYAGLQHNQFWDGRAKNLETQIGQVLKDPEEMHGNMPSILKKLNADKNYSAAFQMAFGKKKSGKIVEKDIYRAIASYIATLNPHNSPFDEYMAGNKKALTENQVAGFNLFMGKAQCGTCHFAPVFNGLVPPAYLLTEFEVLGTPGNDDLKKPITDLDRGRFALYPVSFYENAFKTPTVRNSSATAPYMHNGAFKTLENVIEFYNVGGGEGIGMDVKNQTLSSAHLNLTDTEKINLVAFLEALTDDISKLK